MTTNKAFLQWAALVMLGVVVGGCAEAYSTGGSATAYGGGSGQSVSTYSGTGYDGYDTGDGRGHDFSAEVNTGDTGVPAHNSGSGPASQGSIPMPSGSGAYGTAGGRPAKSE